MSSDRRWLVCDATRQALDELDANLLREAAADDSELRTMATHLLAHGGKRIRPALVFLAGAFGTHADMEVLMRAATGLELLHVASLYHDDVMDRSERRRHSESANARFGNIRAALSGTYLFARATTLLASFGAWANQITSDALVQLSTGQLLEVEHAYNVDLSEAELFDILSRKTATLFELPLRLGAFVGGASEAHVEALASYGRDLGLAFQLADDTLDFIGDQDVAGKTIDRDLRAGVYRLPVLRARRASTSGLELRTLLEQFEPSDDDMQMAKTMIRKSGAIDATLATARERADSARAILGDLPDGPARESLANLADYAVERAS